MKKKIKPPASKSFPNLDNLKDALRGAFSSLKNAQGMGGFILSFCFIEWLAGYYFARDTTAEDYKEFLRRFLPNKYDAESMYHGVRCGLVHNFTVRKIKVQYDFREDAAKYHLKLRPLMGDSKIKLRVINLSNLKDDLETAMSQLFKILDTNPEMCQRALSRYKKVGLISGNIQTF